MKFQKVAKFIYDNRRMIGLVVGGILTIVGYPEAGTYASRVGEV